MNNDVDDPKIIDFPTENLVVILNRDYEITRERIAMGGVFDTKYLTEEKIKGFDKYKYSCIDNSPLSVYISHPFWNWVVEFYPRSWAPNLITLTGWALVMGCFFVESFLDYDLNSNSVGSIKSVPGWFWLFAAVCTFLGHLLDGTDGKQARRIGASGPTGELFDHGLDSWSTVPFTITIFSVFGRGEFSVEPVHLLYVLISVQIVFIATHWEKYNTGTMFLSWGYDASQYGLVTVYLFTYIVGYKWFKFYVFNGINFAQVFETGFYLCCIASVGMSLYNMWYSYSIEKTYKQPNLFETIRPMVPVVTLFAASIFWAIKSPTNVIDRDPRMFFFCVGTVFSNVACRLIISQMSSTRAEVNNWLLVFYTVVVVSALHMSHIELLLLRLSTFIITALHVHYGICVVRQLCAHFKINALDVSYLNKNN